jgi:hypothetical protein
MKRIKFFILIILFPNICLGTVWFITVFEFPIMEVIRSNFWMVSMTLSVTISAILATGLSEKDVESFNDHFKW